MEKVFDLKSCVNSLSIDSYKFFNKSNKAAGVRARKKLQKCKRLAQEIREIIQKVKQEEEQKRKRVISAQVANIGAEFISNRCENPKIKNCFEEKFPSEKASDNITVNKNKKNSAHGKSFHDTRQSINFIYEVEGYRNHHRKSF